MTATATHAKRGADIRDDDTRTDGIADWFASLGVTRVGMESTGVYWRALFNLLEELGFNLAIEEPAA
jgi:transposase